MSAPRSLSGLRGDVRVHRDGAALVSDAAALIARAATDACDRHGSFSIALSGGSTPQPLYRALAAAPHAAAIEWPLWAVYFADERAVPPDDAASNYRLARETLLDHVPIDHARVHRMPADHPDLDLAADEYAVVLHGDLAEATQHAPRLDCIVLGLGDNGHTASLFPGTPALTVRDRWVTRGHADHAPHERLTLTYPTLNAAALVVLLVTGAAKAPALRATAAGETPAAGVRPVDGDLVWLLDREAAGA